MSALPAKQPPRPAAADDDEDLDDLDSVLTEFAAAAPTPSSTAAPTAPTTAESEDFPDPDDEELDLDSLTGDLEGGLAQLLGGLGEGDEEEFRRIMEDIMKGEMGLPPPGPGEMDPAALLASLAGPKGKGREAGSFQDTIGSTLDKLRDSKVTVDAETEKAQANAGETDPLVAMMAQMAGMGGAAGGLGGEEGMQGMLDEMMEQLMSRELLYEPLKELSDKYPAYLTTNGPTLPPADLVRFTQQQTIVSAIVAKFEEPGADAPGPYSPAEEEVRKVRGLEVVELVGKMNECGAPPTEIMGDMPEGMELGPDGIPKMPECTIS